MTPPQFSDFDPERQPEGAFIDWIVGEWVRKITHESVTHGLIGRRQLLGMQLAQLLCAISEIFAGGVSTRADRLPVHHDHTP